VGHLSKLRMLHVRRNKLQALPPALSACSSLLELHAGFNSIRGLPEGLGGLRGLAVLEMRNNLLTVRARFEGWSRVGRVKTGEEGCSLVGGRSIGGFSVTD